MAIKRTKRRQKSRAYLFDLADDIVILSNSLHDAAKSGGPVNDSSWIDDLRLGTCRRHLGPCLKLKLVMI